MNEPHLTSGRQIARGLRRAYLMMHRQTQLLLSPHDLTADQYVPLTLLVLEDGVTQNEITQRASSDANTVRAMLVLMEGKDLIYRRPHDNDRRARLAGEGPLRRRVHPRPLAPRRRHHARLEGGRLSGAGVVAGRASGGSGEA